jgi:hypothetical protein
VWLGMVEAMGVLAVTAMIAAARSELLCDSSGAADHEALDFTDFRETHRTPQRTHQPAQHPLGFGVAQGFENSTMQSRRRNCGFVKGMARPASPVRLYSLRSPSPEDPASGMTGLGLR